MVQAKLVSALSPSLALIFRKVRIPKDWCNTDLKFLTHWEGVQQEGSRRHWSRGIPRKPHCGRDQMRASIFGAHQFLEIAPISMQDKDHSGGTGGYAPGLGLTM